MGPASDAIKPAGCIYHEHDCPSNRQNSMLVKTVDGWVGLKFLFDMAKRSTENPRKRHYSLNDSKISCIVLIKILQLLQLVDPGISILE